MKESAIHERYRYAAGMLTYDGRTGVFRWAVDAGKKVKVGQQAGSVDPSGYLRIGVKGSYVYAHILAFFIQGVAISEGLVVDHRNGKRSDVRWRNLRLVSRTANNQNERKARRNNSTGYLGVSKHRNGFRARITVNSAEHTLGVFKTPVEAYQAYVTAKRQLHEGCTL